MKKRESRDERIVTAPPKLPSKANNKAGRPNKVEKTKRLERILGLIGSGSRTFQMKEILTKEWGVSEASIDKYLSEAHDIIKKSFSIENLEQSFNHLYNKAYESGNYKLCLEILNSIGKLKVKEFESATDVVFNVKFGDDDSLPPISITN